MALKTLNERKKNDADTEMMIDEKHDDAAKTLDESNSDAESNTTEVLHNMFEERYPVEIEAPLYYRCQI